MSRGEQQRRRRARGGPVWARPAPGERRPAWSRDQIVATALAIADAEGWEAVSMRRIAGELGAGTMSLYHYVRTKDELVAFVSDAIMGELLIPDDELPDGWRDGLAEIARRTRAVFLRHPWILRHFNEGEDTPGPNGMRHFEQSMMIAARTGVALEQQFELMMLVDEYVFGHAVHSREENPFGDAGGERERAMLAYVQAQLATGEFPHIEAMAAEDMVGTFRRISAAASDENRFERGLQVLLDGIELTIERGRESA
jgi:AcrR family transcriptional regulator